VDETGFNLSNQGYLYGWSQKGQPLVHRVPAKITNTSLCAAIDDEGVLAYQLFDKGMHSEDFLGFMSNLVNCMKLGRNTSMDEIKDVKNEERITLQDKKKVVFILDNATIHIANKVKTLILDNYNVLLLPPYSPYLNIIELWFS